MQIQINSSKRKHSCRISIKQRGSKTQEDQRTPIRQQFLVCKIHPSLAIQHETAHGKSLLLIPSTHGRHDLHHFPNFGFVSDDACRATLRKAFVLDDKKNHEQQSRVRRNQPSSFQVSVPTALPTDHHATCDNKPTSRSFCSNMFEPK